MSGNSGWTFSLRGKRTNLSLVPFTQGKRASPVFHSTHKKLTKGLDKVTEAEVRVQLRKDELATVASGESVRRPTTAVDFLTAGLQLEDLQYVHLL